MNTQTFEKLIANHDAISNEALKLAIEKRKQDEQAKQVAAVEKILQHYDLVVSSRVKAIKSARELEKQQKAELVKLNAAFEKFKKGDCDDLKKLLGM